MDETRNPPKLETRDPPELITKPSDRKNRTEALLEKRRALDAKIERAMQRDAAESRRVRNRGLLLIGVAIEKQIGKDPSNVTLVRRLIAENLKEREQEAAIKFLDTLSA